MKLHDNTVINELEAYFAYAKVKDSRKWNHFLALVDKMNRSHLRLTKKNKGLCSYVVILNGKIGEAYVLDDSENFILLDMAARPKLTRLQKLMLKLFGIVKR